MGKPDGILVPISPVVSSDRIAVQSAYLQSPTTWNTTGVSVFTSATTLNAKMFPELTMVRLANGDLELSHPVGGRCIIPSANVKIALLK